MNEAALLAGWFIVVCWVLVIWWATRPPPPPAVRAQWRGPPVLPAPRWRGEARGFCYAGVGA